MRAGPLLVAFIPFLPLGVLALWFSSQCVDDFCGALRVEIAVAFLVAMVVIGVVTLFLTSRGRQPRRAALAAWALLACAGATVFASSQAIERDTLTIIVGFALAIAFGAVAGFFARRTGPNQPGRVGSTEQTPNEP